MARRHQELRIALAIVAWFMVLGTTIGTVPMFSGGIDTPTLWLPTLGLLIAALVSIGAVVAAHRNLSTGRPGSWAVFGLIIATAVLQAISFVLSIKESFSTL